MIKLDQLLPEVQDAIEKAIAIMKAQGIRHVVTSTYRSVDEQKALYAQGRQSLESVNALRSGAGMYPISESENKYTVTNCDGVNKKSLHQSRKAVDIVPADKNGNPLWPDNTSPMWVPIALIMKSCGFQWGGDWKDFPDYPHYQM